MTTAKSKIKNQKSKIHLRGPSPLRVFVLIPAFTLMELMVSVSILIILILAIGHIFSTASKAVGISNATNEIIAAVRSTQQLLERDLSRLDKNGFLVIRTRMYNPAMGDASWRFDQMAFVAGGAFPNRSGADTANPFTDSSIASGAIIWWGQGVIESASPPDASYIPSGQGNLPAVQGAQWQASLPTGVIAGSSIIKEAECTLLRHPLLLYPGPANASGHISPVGNAVMTYPSPKLGAGTIKASTENSAAHITSSRFCAVAQTATQIMQGIINDHVNNGITNPELDLTFRYRALASVYDTEITTNPFVNGYFRTTPTVMQGVSSFKIEWTDGSSYNDNTDPRFGQLRWFGPSNRKNNPAADPEIHNCTVPGDLPTFLGNGDHYDAIFSYYNKANWPKALRVTMHVASDRIGGRDFTQVINLPQ